MYDTLLDIVKKMKVIWFGHEVGAKGATANTILQGKGLCKLKKFQKSKRNWIELTPPTHPHPNFCFGNPSLTWTEHSNHNNQQLLAMYNTDIIHMVYYSKISVHVYWFRAILGRFSKKKFRVRHGPTHPPTSIVISDVWNFFLCKSPNR